MKNKRLSRRQHWRIKKIQDERMKRAEQSEERFQTAMSTGELGPEERGLVVSHFGRYLEVEAHGQSYQCKFRQNLGAIVTGDAVAFHKESDETGVIVAVFPRKQLLARGYAGGELKPIAANVDQMLIVTAMNPWLHSIHIDRYLVISEREKIPACLVFNKIDLLTPELAPLQKERKSLYESLGYTCIEASTRHRDGLNDLLKTLHQKTSILVGPSGVGKSSIIRFLLPFEPVQIGQLSAHALGRHTTTTARFYHLQEQEGAIIDSPGIREMGIWHIGAGELIDGYRELKMLASQCKFRDCRHLSEPECAIQKAVFEGSISLTRFQNYQTLYSDLLKAH